LLLGIAGPTVYVRYPERSRRLYVHQVVPRFAQSYSTAWSPDGKRLAHSQDDGVYSYDALTGGEVIKYATPGVAEVAAWSPNGLQIAAAWSRLSSPSNAEDRSLRVWNARTGDLLLAQFPTHEQIVGPALAWSPDSTRIATLVSLPDYDRLPPAVSVKQGKPYVRIPDAAAVLVIWELGSNRAVAGYEIAKDHAGPSAWT
jgi:WD40 repeat protein